jgi:hypothetical protein
MEGRSMKAVSYVEVRVDSDGGEDGWCFVTPKSHPDDVARGFLEHWNDSDQFFARPVERMVVGYLVRRTEDKSPCSRVYSREGDAKRWVSTNQRWRGEGYYEIVPAFMEA